MGRLRRLLGLGWLQTGKPEKSPALTFESGSRPTAEPERLQLTPWSAVQLIHIFRQLSQQPDRASLEGARASRDCLSRFWLAAPVDQLETLYAGPIGEAHRLLLAGILPALPLDPDEERWKATLTHHLLESFDRPESPNVLLALLPYYDRAALRVAEAQRRIPAWLLLDYAERCEPALAEQLRQLQPAPRPALPAQALPHQDAPAAEATALAAAGAPPLPDLAPLQGDDCMALITDAGFLGRVGGLINLYAIDPADAEVKRELAAERRQVAQVWLDVETGQIEALYRTSFGQLTANLIASGFAREPISSEEETVRLQLGAVLGSLEHPRSLNALMAAMLYVPAGRVSFSGSAEAKLPAWVLGELEQWRSRSPV
jgi:hypothetical protein